jgi:hypothetical protein
MKRAATLLALCLSTAACPHPAPEVRHEPRPEVPGTPAAELQRRYAWLSGPGYEDPRPEIMAGLAFDSVSLERGACYGTCPVYQVVLRRDLNAVYRGERFVERTGTWYGAISLTAYGRLSYLIERMGVMSMRSSYTRGVTDHSTYVLRIWPRGAATPKVVEEYAHAGPPELWAVMAAVDAISGGTQWSRSPPAP